MDCTQILFLDQKITQWDPKDRNNSFPQEVIGIDIALLDTTKNIILEQEKLIVKPKKAIVTSYCESKCGISQADVNKGIDFLEAYRKIRIHYMSPDRVWGGWGNMEPHILNGQCKKDSLEYPFDYDYIDVQFLYSMMMGVSFEDQSPSMAYILGKNDMKISANYAVNAASIFTKMSNVFRLPRGKIIASTSAKKDSGLAWHVTSSGGSGTN